MLSGIERFFREACSRGFVFATPNFSLTRLALRRAFGSPLALLPPLRLPLLLLLLMLPIASRDEPEFASGL